MNSAVHVLIAEDSPTQACRLEHILRQQGYEVSLAANGVLALACARESPPSLVISDVVMPEMDGYELCRQLKQDPQLNHIPVILVTALSELEDVIKALQCHADNFVMKPYDEDYLLLRVSEVLARGDGMPPDPGDPGVEIVVKGKTHLIGAARVPILSLLLSTYDAAIHRNRELTVAKEDLQHLNLQLKAANEELEAFSYSVSHDLRAPLRHVRGFAGLLEKRMGGNLDAQAHQYLEQIVSGAAKMSRLVDDLLAFSRTVHAEMKKSSVDLGQVVSESWQSLMPEWQGRHVKWHQSVLPVVEADPAMLRQVYVNLLSNAVKYTRRCDLACIEAGFIDGSEPVYFVKDNGAGFDMSQASRLFGVFQRLHRDDEFEGAGIGLATVQRILNRHGGRIWAESAINQGTTFSFTLGQQSSVSG